MENDSVDLRQLMNIILKRLWLIIILPIVAAAASAYWTFFVLDPVYEANTTLFILNRQQDPELALAYSDIMVGQLLVKDYRELVKSRVVTSAVIKRMQLDGISPDGLAAKISVNSRNDTRIIEIRVRDKDPRMAGKLADAVAEEFKVKIRELMKVENVDVIDKAQIPSAPTGPRTLVNIAAALFLGLFAAAGLAFIMDYLDDTVKTAEDIESQMDLPVLGTIPKSVFI